MGAPGQRNCLCFFMANVVGLASCAEQTPVAEPGELSADDDDYGYGLDTDGTQEAVSMATHQESAVKIEFMHYLHSPPPRNFLVCWHFRMSRQHLWSIIPPCHPWHLSNGCLVLVVWLLHREEIGFQMKILSASWCWKRTAVFSTNCEVALDITD